MMYQTETMADSTKIAAFAIDGSQPAWMTLNAARELAFTGEIVFESDPDVHAYLDNGIVYYAERLTDATLGRRLLDAGVLDMIQLERGTVRVGDIEHLGRLFDRDPSVDRDAVIVLAETATQELITDLANRAITTVRATAYRHHPSGVHRWFVAPIEPAEMTRPVSMIAQLDTTVVSQLPGLPFGSGIEELTIEWDDQTIEWDDDTDEPDDDGTTNDGTTNDGTTIDGETSQLEFLEVPDETDKADEATELVLEAFAPPLGLAEFTNGHDLLDLAAGDVVDAVDAVVLSTIEDVFDVTDEAEIVAVVTVVTVDTFVTVEETVDPEFTVVWPDVPDEQESSDKEDHPEAHHPYVVDVAPALVHTDDGNIEFAMPPLTLSDEPELADADVPEDVAAAVRSVIAAIESAGFATPSAGAGMTLRSGVPAQLPDIVAIEPTGPIDVVPGAFSEFAPPTLATSAQALYGQPMADSASVGVPTFATASLAGGAVAAAADDPSDRSSALRRLIGSLRRKDH